MIGRLYSVVLDTREPRALANFYAQVTGLSLLSDEEDWVTIGDGAGVRLAFQRSPRHEPPTFPDPRGSQQFHLDILVDDVDEAEKQVLALGAQRLDGGGDDFRVYADPAGHPFCLVWENA